MVLTCTFMQLSDFELLIYLLAICMSGEMFVQILLSFHQVGDFFFAIAGMAVITKMVSIS